MTVAQLIAALAYEPQDNEVVLAFDDAPEAASPLSFVRREQRAPLTEGFRSTTTLYWSNTGDFFELDR